MIVLHTISDVSLRVYYACIARDDASARTICDWPSKVELLSSGVGNRSTIESDMIRTPAVIKFVLDVAYYTRRMPYREKSGLNSL